MGFFTLIFLVFVYVGKILYICSSMSMLSFKPN